MNFKQCTIKHKFHLSKNKGWTKFYEFSNADLRVAADIIDRLSENASKRNKTLITILKAAFENMLVIYIFLMLR